MDIIIIKPQIHNFTLANNNYIGITTTCSCKTTYPPQRITGGRGVYEACTFPIKKVINNFGNRHFHTFLLLVKNIKKYNASRLCSSLFNPLNDENQALIMADTRLSWKQPKLNMQKVPKSMPLRIRLLRFKRLKTTILEVLCFEQFYKAFYNI